MQSIFKSGNKAIVTGAAMGIGKATAIHMASIGMHVCMVDILADELKVALTEARASAEAAGHSTDNIFATEMDVAGQDAWPKLRKQIDQQFGQLHVLMNNAVTREGKGFDVPLAEWREAMEINFWSIVNGIETFLPIIQKTQEKTCIINVGSKQGITNPPGHPIYNISKSALKTYSEQLAHRFRNDSDFIETSVHLLVPGWTTTGKNPHNPGAWLPQQVVDRMISEIDKEVFYIVCPDNEVSEAMDAKRILWGAADITEKRPPLSRWHEKFKDGAADACN